MHSKRGYPVSENAAIKMILEGTAPETGRRFFRALVKNVSMALGTKGAWVTEYLRDHGRLRSLAFWLDNGFLEHYEYDIAGTPCEPVINSRQLCHFRDNISQLFPKDHDLPRFNAVSYMGVPLFDTDDTILGHLAVLDSEILPDQETVEPLFRIFASRASAELRRMRAEADLREREEKLSRLFSSAMDAIIELDQNLNILDINKAGEKAFCCKSIDLNGRSIGDFLAEDSFYKLRLLAKDISAREVDRKYLWISGGLTCANEKKEQFQAEATLSGYMLRGREHLTLILRNVNDRLEADRKIETLSRESRYLREELEGIQNQNKIIGKSDALLKVLDEIKQVAPTDTTVLLAGATGTGKELFACALHNAGKRSGMPMIKVNCAAIPSNLIESEFFGHEKGAFTGATQKREGRFALADGGTIFLDEIGELPYDLQAKLLRVLQEGEFEPVGSSATCKIDVRVIAATNRDLKKMISEGRFREDLYYRLNVFPIQIPPLKERGDDILLLAEEFLQRFARKTGQEVCSLSDDCIYRLKSYNWPGNVRELENVIERAVITSKNGRLNLAGVLPEISPDQPEIEPDDSKSNSGRILTAHELLELEKQNLIRALDTTGWRVSGDKGAARLLDVPSSTLSSRIKALNLRRPQ